MNNKIRKFAEEAGLRFTMLTSNPMIPFVDGRQQDLEKFAELIIQECAGLFVNQRYMILDPLKPFAEERVRVLKHHDKHTVSKILRHFGVEA
jgi:hypothetical protein